LEDSANVSSLKPGSVSWSWMGQRPRTSPQSDGDEQAGRLVGTVRARPTVERKKNSGEMKREDPNGEHQAEAGRAPARQHIEPDAQACSDESGAEERDPEHVPRNPRRYQR